MQRRQSNREGLAKKIILIETSLWLADRPEEDRGVSNRSREKKSITETKFCGRSKSGAPDKRDLEKDSHRILKQYYMQTDGRLYITKDGFHACKNRKEDKILDKYNATVLPQRYQTEILLRCIAQKYCYQTEMSHETRGSVRCTRRS